MRPEILLFLKGMLMGAADIVPGVSGGTIAFITGIYERLIYALKSVIPATVDLYRQRNLQQFWQTIDGSFLLTLFAGILSSVALLANLITHLLSTYPILLWSFFFGLIVASVFIVASHVKQWRLSYVPAFVVGIVVAWGITIFTPATVSISLPIVFLSGMVAICAMILPGISGSFILVLLGTYGYILGALKSLDVYTILVFVSGCLFGLLSIANVLSWAFSRFHDATLMLLTGFMVGALNKVWPWKQVLSYRENRHGELVPLVEKNVTPFQFESVSGVSSELFSALFLAFFAAVLVIFLERIGRKL